MVGVKYGKAAVFSVLIAATSTEVGAQQESTCSAAQRENLKQAEVSAAKGREYAQLGLAYGHLAGLPCYEKSDVLALRWFRAAAAKDNTEAQFMMGQMLFLGKGSQVNYAESFRWFNAAALKKDRRAMTYLGILYRDGLGVPKNAAAAFRWMKLAAEAPPRSHSDYVEPRYYLAMMYWDGVGTPRNEAEALRWLHESAKYYEPSQKKLAELRAKIGPHTGAVAGSIVRSGDWGGPTGTKASTGSSQPTSFPQVRVSQANVAILSMPNKQSYSHCLEIATLTQPPSALPLGVPEYLLATSLYDPKDYRKVPEAGLTTVSVAYRNICKHKIHAVIIACKSRRYLANGAYDTAYQHWNIVLKAAGTKGEMEWHRVTRLTNAPQRTMTNFDPYRENIAELVFGAWPNVYDAPDLITKRSYAVFDYGVRKILKSESNGHTTNAGMGAPSSYARNWRQCSDYSAQDMVRVWQATN